MFKSEVIKRNFVWTVVSLVLVFGLIGCGGGGSSGTGAGSTPDIVVDTCKQQAPGGGCLSATYGYPNGFLDSITLWDYVRNNGGTGVINVQITAGTYTVNEQFNVDTGTSYIFKTRVPVREGYSWDKFTLTASFPGTPGLVITTDFEGYRLVGAPSSTLVAQ